ncbi:hypothetical protein [Paraburkholderia aspalathi]|uniref:Uncharacterized protein n=1 Tax=Paraburkholderia aspalathi TaxID=1324617 RepID=A0A1I7ENQ1_9BURK|nr:hypothetical protein [Paraburkholderia aspalathi]SFU25539.1 hypothetical protein SAMN05192563_103811 [Paraburkholderia aspalathi]
MSTKKSKSRNGLPALQGAGAAGLVLPNFRRDFDDDSLIQNAMDYVSKLIDVYESGPHFYANLDSTILERWLSEDWPELIEALTEEATLEAFRRNLIDYCSRLSAAGAIADSFLGETLDYEQGGYWDFDVERFFPGLHRRVLFGKVKKLEQLPSIIAVLVEKFTRKCHVRIYDNNKYPRYSRLPSEGWDWCDLAQVKHADDRTAFLLRKEHFPIQLGWETHERYALVLNASPGTSASTLIDHSSPFHIAPLTNSSGKVIACCRPTEGVTAIPFLENHSTLTLFRRFIPVIYLLPNGPLLIQYEWSMMATGNLYVREAREIEDRYASDSPANANDNAEAHITQILPMPLGAGPKPKPQHAGPWNDAWSDCIPC